MTMWQGNEIHYGKSHRAPMNGGRLPSIIRSSDSHQGEPMQMQMSKSQLVAKIAELQKLAKKDVKAMMESLAEVGYKELKKNGVFVVPGFAKFVVVKKPATKARVGKNP